MSLPIVVTWNLAASSATAVVNAAPVTGAKVAFTLATSILNNQQRLLITTSGDESGNTFTIVGTNQAGFPITESITGPNTSTTQTNLDFKTITSIKALSTTAATVSVGTDGVGSTPWYIMNWHADPDQISVAGVVVGTTAVNWGVQYTYDDPNNLPAGVSFPAVFAHPTLNNLPGTTSLDGAIDNGPVTGVRFIINSGTGTLRGTIIQAGIGTP